ncbi:MAG: SDR family NAD(P)-dependent oxidoreductase, partial [Bacteroidetes bacterium]|nr:SDR family NAD(P)-dependent oxidoreductase [Bacteroidota bacterium]
MNRFYNKVAVVTGGCRGIGKAVVLRFLKEGAKVYALDYVVPNKDEVFIEDDMLSKNIVIMQLDVTNAEQVEEVFSKINELEGKIDFLVNNAGITRDSLLIRLSEDNWDAVINTNLKGAFLCTKAVSKYMMQKRYGRIVNLGSVVGIMGNAGQANYSASKAGLIGLTKSVAKELGSRNILVN